MTIIPLFMKRETEYLLLGDKETLWNWIISFHGTMVLNHIILAINNFNISLAYLEAFVILAMFSHRIHIWTLLRKFAQLCFASCVFLQYCIHDISYLIIRMTLRQKKIVSENGYKYFITNYIPLFKAVWKSCSLNLYEHLSRPLDTSTL